jgi:hypothetical protein
MSPSKVAERPSTFSVPRALRLAVDGVVVEMRFKVTVVEPFAFVAVTVAEKTLVASGVPEISPVATFNEAQEGKPVALYSEAGGLAGMA